MRNVLIIFGTVLALAVFVSAQYPIQIYGTLSVSGDIVPDGTEVEFQKSGFTLISATTKDERYGYEEPLFIDGEELTIGDVITINVNGEEVYDMTYLGGADLGIDLDVPASVDIRESITGAAAARCVTEWQCSDWSACINNIQTRDCIDNNNCGVDDDKPITLRDCVSGPEPETVPLTPVPVEPEVVQPPEPKNYAWIFYLVVLAAIGLVIVALVRRYNYYKHAPSEQPHRFVHLSLKEGHSETNIKQKLSDKGWRQGHVEEVVQLEKLRHYIIDELRRGVPREELIDYLVKYGWDRGTVEELMP